MHLFHKRTLALFSLTTMAIAVSATFCQASPEAVGCDYMFAIRPIRLPLEVPGLNPCKEISDRGASIVVVTDSQILVTCESGSPVKQYPVALGRCGVGKTTEGDGKTPVGTYQLANPSESASGFGQFIPVGYPTRAQTREGYSGGAIGIHGPKSLKNDGVSRHPLGGARAFNWTQGCIALDSYDAVNEVSRFVSRHSGLKIHILPLDNTQASPR
jgi:hypothetical protein